MNGNKSRVVSVFIILTGTISLIVPLLNSLISFLNSTAVNVYISFIPNCIILINSYLMWLYLTPTEEEEEKARLCDDFRCFSRREFIRYILIAMNVGFLATILIYIIFLAGVFLYLIMHIILILAYSRVINLKPADISKDSYLLRSYLFSFIFWLLFTPFLFFALVWRGKESLVLLPYAGVLGFMAAVSFAALFNLHTPLLFRLMIFFGSLVFVISDLFIGLTGPEMNPTFRYWINPTYITAIFLISHSILPLTL